MKVTRRQFLQWSALSLNAAQFSAQAMESATERRLTPSILQGATDSTKTQFSIVYDRSAKFSVFAKTSSGKILHPDKLDEFVFENHPGKITRPYFSGLQLGQDYQLVLLGRDKKPLDERTFQALDVNKGSAKFALCSCMDDAHHEPEIWRDLIGQNPDAIFFIGDAVYVDKGGGDDVGGPRLWRRFYEAATTLEIYYSKRLIPIFATWDDHDFGMNDSGKEYPFVSESQRNFMQYFAMEPSHCSALERGPGVSSSLILGGQHFIFTDDRSWRFSSHSRDRYAHWGREQEDWIFSKLDQFKGFSWILNGTQMFPQMLFKQSFSGEHPVQFEAFQKRIANLNKKVALASGDVHFSEISEIEDWAFGYRTFELTSSSIHSRGVPGAPWIIPNPRRMVSTGEKNYLLVDSQPTKDGCDFLVESRSAGNRINFSLNLSV